MPVFLLLSQLLDMLYKISSPILIVFCVLVFAKNGYGQDYTTVKTTNSDALSAYREGLHQQRDLGEYAISLGYFEKALKSDPKFIDAVLDLAHTHALLRDHFKAKQFFLQGIAIDSLYEPLAFYEVAKSEWTLDQYAEAVPHLEAFLRSSPKNPKTRSAAEHLLANARFAAYAVAHPVDFHPQSLGPGINTGKDEYFPSLTADGETLIFTRNDGNDENFYRSQLKDGVWQKAEPLEGVNTPLNEGAQAISPDGTWLVFTACNRERDGSQGSCDLYWSQERSNGWTKPAPFSATINSSSWDSQPSISADGKTIIFSSRRPGGFGKEDLWFTTRQPGGKWSAPENLGPNINTGGVEQTPFYHPDGQTLYFCSDSLPGMGGYDLFCVRRNPDGSWGTPQNLGYPINTKQDEVALTVSLDGKTAFFATNIRPGGKRGDLDIYSFEMPEAVRPKPVTYVKVHVRDAVTGNNLFAKLDMIDLKTGQTYVSVNTRKDGTALACLPAGKDYALNAGKDKYFFHSENFNLVDSASFTRPFLLDVSLQPIPDSASLAVGGPEAGKIIELRNVFFNTGSAELLPASTAELDRLVALLNQAGYLRIQINGHTDNVGNKTSNQTLSEARAKSVMDYLIGHGIAADRLRSKGFGETKPVETNNTVEGRARNRRTEFMTF
jgi:outer membrane protein OmpA-like peptidoglycan-associated protein/Tol biopolymer transport system component